MKLPLVIAVCAGLVVAGSVQSDEIKINQQFTGVSHAASSLDTNGDGIFAGSSSFQSSGSPGRSTGVSVGEFTEFEFVGTPGCDLRSEMVLNSYVQTFNDGSMLFTWWTEGFSCFDLVTSEVWGEGEGIVTGGTGRFNGATGEWTTEFKVYLATPAQEAFTGSMKGSIEIPD